MTKVTKKQLVAKIRGLLNSLNASKDGCVYVQSIPNITWVGFNQVMKRKPLGGALYRNYRVGLYSKEVSIDELIAISNEIAQKEWYSIKDGNKYQNYGLCSDGLYHWEKDQNYAGYTAQEMIDMGAE